MQSIATGNETFIDTPLTLKVRQASRSIPRKLQWRLFIIGLFTVDMLMIGLAFRLAYHIRFNMNIAVFQEDAISVVGYYELIVFFLLPVWLAIFTIFGLYNRKNLLGGTREYAKVFNSTAIGMFIMIATGFMLPEFVFARGWLLLSGGLAFALVVVARFTMRHMNLLFVPFLLLSL